MPPISGAYIVFVLSVIPSIHNSSLIFTWIFLVTRPFRGHQNIWPCDFDLGVWTLTLLITFEQWVLDFWNYTWIFLVLTPFCWPWHLTYLEKITLIGNDFLLRNIRVFIIHIVLLMKAFIRNNNNSTKLFLRGVIFRN